MWDFRAEKRGKRKLEPRRANVKTYTEPAGWYPPLKKMSRVCLWMLEIYQCFHRWTSPSPPCEQPVWTREGWRAKRWGRELGGGQRSMEEGPACGAVDLGWGSTLYRGVCVCRGVTTLTFHVPPLPSSYPPFTLGVCLSVVSMTTLWLWRCSRRNRRVRERRGWWSFEVRRETHRR